LVNWFPQVFLLTHKERKEKTMAHFAQNAQQAKPLGVTKTTTKAFTHEGALGYSLDAKTELYTLSVSSFHGQDSYYEKGTDRADRFAALVQQVTKEDPDWVRAFIPWLRNEANIRSNSIAAACEYVAAGGPNGRDVINSAIVRADEPAEVFGYWISRYGRKLPAPVKRGLADAAQRLYNERNALKWDQSGSNVRMGDIIAMVHPKPVGDWQSSLFTYLMDMRHKRDNPRGLENLSLITNVLNWRAAALKGDVDFNLPEGVTWEALSSMTKMDKTAWEAIIPQMGYMALIRNLRNFEQAGISNEMVSYINNKIADPEEVANSRQLPMRFWSSYLNSGSLKYAQALEEAMNLSLNNIPHFGGKTLVMVDTSGSMSGFGYSERSTVRPLHQGAIFGSAIARASDSSVVAIYASGVGTVKTSSSVLRTAETIINASGTVGHGTNTWPSVKQMWKEHGPFDRVLVFTDMQDHPSHASAADVPKNVPVYVWDLAGHKTANIELGSGRYLFGGLNDQSFKSLKLVEDFKPGVWPWTISE
jgi:hypothetical protein